MMGFGFGAVGMILIWALIIGGVIWIVKAVAGRGNSNRSGEPHQTRSPLEILKTRYASGEISKDEYDRLKKEIVG